MGEGVKVFFVVFEYLFSYEVIEFEDESVVV